MGILCILGFVLLALPFVAMFVFVILQDGIKLALAVFGTIIGIVVVVIAYTTLVVYLLSHCA